MRTRIVVASGFRLVRDVMTRVLLQQENLHLVGLADDVESIGRLLEQQAVDLLVLVDPLQSMDKGIMSVHTIKMLFPRVKVLVVSASTDGAFVSHLMEHGVDGYLTKRDGLDSLIEAMPRMRDGGRVVSPHVEWTSLAETDAANPDAAVLTRREAEVLQCVSEGRTTREIATALHISEYTVNSHRVNIMDKLGVRSIAELTKKAIRMGVTEL